jgi:hypothetical protein
MPDEPISDAALTRLVVRAIAAAIALVGATAIVAVVQRWERSDDPAATTATPLAASSPSSSTDADADEDQAFVATRGIGPVAGQPVIAYVQARTAALSRAKPGDRRAAVVSLTHYVAAADVAGVIGKVDGVDVDAIVVAAPGGAPATVELSGLRDWATAERHRAAQERAELERLLPTVDDAEFDRTYRDDMERLHVLERDVEAAADRDVVFAVVVVGRVDQLRRLAAMPDVRLVDIGRGRDGGVPDAADVTALRPEETAKAGEPRYRPTSG